MSVTETVLDPEGHVPSSNDSEAETHALWRCEKPKCRTHNGLCAFHGDEPGRCPLCHSAWLVILARDWHSCEQARNWPPHERGRVTEGRELRKAAERFIRRESGGFMPAGDHREHVCPRGADSRV